MAVRLSERPTIAPAFDVAEYARDSERRVASVAPSKLAPPPVPEDFPPESDTKPSSEVRIVTRPQWGVVLTNQAWARSIRGAPYVAMSNEALKRLPLDHRAGFVLSLMDGSLDLETIVELCGMEPEEALGLVRDLHASGVIGFR